MILIKNIHSTYFKVLILIITLLHAGFMFSQPNTLTVTGVVTDETGDLLPGVSVVVKGTSVGTITNFDGEFSVKVNEEDDMLVFSYIGYVVVEHPVQLNTTMQVV